GELSTGGIPIRDPSASESGPAGADSVGAAERPLEQRVDRRLPVRAQEPRAGAAEQRLADDRGFLGAPAIAGPDEPPVALLVEDEGGLAKDLRVLAGDARAAGDRVVVVDLADEEHLVGVVHLVPDALQHLAEERRVGELPVHQSAHVAEADVAAPQLRLGQDAAAALARGVVALE